MGESKKRLNALRQLVSTEPRCIYCPSLPDSIEHMPPIWFFKGNHRPRGMEYAACKKCNEGTKASDFVTGWLSRIRPFRGDLTDPLVAEAAKKNGSLDQLAPGLREELFNDKNTSLEWVRGPHGLFEQVVSISADGPILAHHLATSAAKLGMALFREHTGQALPLEGRVYVQPFMNAGLSQHTLDQLLGMLPALGTLAMGKWNVQDQFAYRYNSNERDIVFAIAGLHSNVHLMVCAVIDTGLYGPTLEPHFCTSVSPGELLAPRGISTFLPTRLQESARTKSAMQPPRGPGSGLIIPAR